MIVPQWSTPKEEALHLMSDPTEAPSMEARITNLFHRVVNDAVRGYGLKRTWVRKTLAPEWSRVYVNADGAICIRTADGSGAFLPNDALAASLLAKEVGDAAPDEALMDLVEQHQEDIVQEQEERADREAAFPAYRL